MKDHDRPAAYPRPPAPNAQAVRSYRRWPGKKIESSGARKSFAVRFEPATMEKLVTIALQRRVPVAQVVRELVTSGLLEREALP